MHTSSPSYRFPSTPHSDRSLYYGESNSSPFSVASSSFHSSPLTEAQTRRKSQYKSRTSSASLADSPLNRRKFRTASGATVSSSLSKSGSSPGAMLLQSETRSLRDRRLFGRAGQKAVNRKRSQAGSDDVFMDCDLEEEETDEQLMSDELYRRVMTNSNHQDRHRLMRTFYEDCGSSFDPDLEDPTAWERDLDSSPETAPEESEDAELEAYATEYEDRIALADFEDIPLEELFDANEDDTSSGDVDMDMKD